MYKYTDFLDFFADRYVDKIENNKEKLIEAFVKYYGETYRDRITKLIEKTNYFCFIPDKFNILVEEVLRKEKLEEELDITYQIIDMLGITNIKNTDCVLGDIKFQYGKITITPNKLCDVTNKDNQKIDAILTTIFGSNNIFCYNYENIPLYNFFNLTKTEQLEFNKKVFNTTKITPEIIERIKNVINYMDELKEKTNGYQKYIDSVIILNYYEFLERKRRYHKSKGLISAKENKELKKVNRIIASTNEDVPEMILHHMPTTLISNHPTIALPYMLMTDTFLIHEFNHVITSETLAIINDCCVIEKNGIDTYNSYDSFVQESSRNPNATFEEILNERSAIEITNIFHELGGAIFEDSNSCDIEMRIPYREMAPILESFYQEYKSVIKEARITLNSNKLYQYFNKEVFWKLKNLIASYYEKLYFKGQNLYERDIERINELLSMIKREPFEEDIEDYLKKLENEGYKIKRMLR